MTLIEKIQNEISENEIMYATIAKPSHQMASAHVGTIAGLMIALNLAKEHSDWISVNEHLPRESNRYICAIKWHNVTGLITRDAIYFDERHGFDVGEGKSVTHWQALPQPPSEVQNANH